MTTYLPEIYNSLHPKIKTIVTEKILCPVCKEPLNTDNLNDIKFLDCKNSIFDLISVPQSKSCPISFRISLTLSSCLTSILNYHLIFNFKDDEIKFCPLYPLSDPDSLRFLPCHAKQIIKIKPIPSNLNFDFTKESLEQKLKLWLTFS